MSYKPVNEAQSWRIRATDARAKGGDEANRLRGIAAIIADTYERVAEQIDQRDAEEKARRRKRG